MVRKDGEKMSKSLGNLVMVSDLLREYPADALRLYLASYQYRNSWEYNAAPLQEAANQAKRWQAAVAGAARGTAAGNSTVRQAFCQAMDDDLNTPQAITVLDELANDLLRGKYRGGENQAAQATLMELAGILGMRLGTEIEPRVIKGWNRHRREFE
jgi:cysteinyl-tRNA synthetase